MEEITIRMPDDFHVHLREGDLLKQVLPHTVGQFRRALVMPNTEVSILDASGVIQYQQEIQRQLAGSSFKPLMTIQITDSTTCEMIIDAVEVGAIAGKVYPRGMTTNSENGVMNYENLWPVFETMEKYGMVLCLHGESPAPDVFCLDRERAFLLTLYSIVESFPELKIVMEHVTTHAAVKCIKYLIGLGCLNIAATITVHHLFLTLDDVIGGTLQPHHFCKPIAKRPKDRKALIDVVLSQDPHFFLGTDSAPHTKERKECASGCAGVFTAPVALPLLAEFFSGNNALSRMEGFCSQFGADFYGLSRNTETLTLVKRPWVVPPSYVGVVPFYAGKEISWAVK